MLNSIQVFQIYKKLMPYIRPWLSIKPDPQLNASSSLLFTTVNQGSVDSYNDDEMALCLGHELGHWLRLDSFRPNTHAAEFAADAIGARLAHKAGFDVVKGCERFYKFSQRETSTHPHPMARRAALLKLYGE